ncbi:hypothetical protein Agub_g4733, partial [Astrephomene gubernaculifera]
GAHARLLAAHRGRRAAEAAEAAAAAADAAERRRVAPSEIPVVCNGLAGVFLVGPCLVRSGEGRTLSPTEFERIAGKAASKKWKVTLRVLTPGGTPGPTLGEHLVELGLEEPPAPRPRGQLAQAIANLDAFKRRQQGAPPPQTHTHTAGGRTPSATGSAEAG